MMSSLLSGKDVRNSLINELSSKVEKISSRPGLAVILVGEDPASQVYVRNKSKACEKAGFYHQTIKLDASVTQSELLDLINELNADSTIDGILVQIPLPAHICEATVQNAVDPAKDVDGFHPENLGMLLAGTPRYIPCTPKGVVHLLNYYNIHTSGKNVAIVGRSVIVGRPLSMLLSMKTEMGNATVTLCHSRTTDLAEVVSRADIVVAAIGIPEFLTREHIAKDAVVIDVGINRVEDSAKKSGYRLTGDVHPDALDGWASAYTPVPGGVGPMTIAMLLQNTWDSHCLRNNIDV
ncbi:bifunctional 5,10-methylenetetrahydrofolate dehydrogenase/5,10-methenyltetrahydrofolate cyclohydrolase [bacterium]|nr:bifunctional 5,10-methylenetetrahydrofolate dehydrogenase/5,10-methenyltetrahydrofolate cyclohydrolase [bacterium]